MYSIADGEISMKNVFAAIALLSLSAPALAVQTVNKTGETQYVIQYEVTQGSLVVCSSGTDPENASVLLAERVSCSIIKVSTVEYNKVNEYIMTNPASVSAPSVAVISAPGRPSDGSVTLCVTITK